MKAPIPTCLVDLETMEKKYFSCIRRAAYACGVSPDMARLHMIDDRNYQKWYFCRTDEVNDKAERIRYLGVKWRSEGIPLDAQRKPKVKLVSLRIDSHTVIMVPPDKATPEYAEQYREKLSKNSYKSIESSNP